MHRDLTATVGEGMEKLLGEPMRDLRGLQILQPGLMSLLLPSGDDDTFKLHLPDFSNKITDLINKLLKGKTVTIPDQAISADGFNVTATNITCGDASIGHVELKLGGLKPAAPLYTVSISVADLKATCNFITAITKSPFPFPTLDPSPSTATSTDTNLTISMSMGKDADHLPINATGACGAAVDLKLFIKTKSTFERALVNALIGALTPQLDTTLNKGICDGMGSFPGVVKLIDTVVSGDIANATHWVEDNWEVIVQELKDLLKELEEAIHDIIENIDEILKKLEEKVIQKLEHWIEQNTHNGTNAQTQGNDFPTSVKIALIVFFAFVFLAFLYAGCRHHQKTQASVERQNNSLLANQ